MQDRTASNLVRIARAALVAASLLPAACASPDEPSAAVLVAPDLEGRSIAPFEAPDRKAVVLLFVATECPISNYFAPEVERIHAAYSDRGVSFHLVYSDEDESPEDIRRHVEDFSYSMPALLDFDHVLVAHTGATMTPEAAVFTPGGELVYRGRIDDTYVDYGKQRVEPTQRDLRAALDAVLEGRPPDPDRTQTVGCYIPDLEPRGS